MWDKVLPIVGGIFAGIGIILIFFDVITSIKRRDKTRTNIAGLVVLAVAVIGYVITDLILPDDSMWPPLASLVWIALFWVYVILDACVTVGAIKHARRNKKKRTEQEQTEQEQPTDTVNGQQPSEQHSDEQPQQQSAPSKKKKHKSQQNTDNQ